jgi:hypothetical protein
LDDKTPPTAAERAELEKKLDWSAAEFSRYAGGRITEHRLHIWSHRYGHDYPLHPEWIKLGRKKVYPADKARAWLATGSDRTPVSAPPQPPPIVEGAPEQLPPSPSPDAFEPYKPGVYPAMSYDFDADGRLLPDIWAPNSPPPVLRQIGLVYVPPISSEPISPEPISSLSWLSELSRQPAPRALLLVPPGLMSAALDSPPPLQLPAPGELTPKRSGRPLGSKNKPKERTGEKAKLKPLTQRSNWPPED